MFFILARASSAPLGCLRRRSRSISCSHQGLQGWAQVSGFSSRPNYARCTASGLQRFQEYSREMRTEIFLCRSILHPTSPKRASQYSTPFFGLRRAVRSKASAGGSLRWTRTAPGFFTGTSLATCWPVSGYSSPPTSKSRSRRGAFDDVTADVGSSFDGQLSPIKGV